MKLKAHETTTKIDKIELHQNKTVCAVKLPFKKVKKSSTNQEKIFANHIPNEELVP